jgi:hypothetical protein
MREIMMAVALMGLLGAWLGEPKPTPKKPTFRKCAGTVDPHGNCRP